ncbi:MAG: penicillin-binding protein 1C [Bacteroidales bacterium]|jgi:penicillin-binding protein 1C|nr:penicillin-binding protein 1C [Bacteroidales bacterium]
MKLSKKRLIIIAATSVLLIIYWVSLPRTLFDVSYSTVVTDRNGELLGARIADDEQWRFPAVDDVPEKFKVCLIEFEDRYFYNHWGINFGSIVRAAIQNIKSKKIVSGGSTITMQVIRLSRNNRRTILEKCIEAILATRLEFRYSKEHILAMYANHAPFGGNVVGIEAAAWRYFGHSADKLSWAETATLAVLPNAPSMLHLAKNREQLLRKRNRLLQRLHEKKYIDEITYSLAISEDLPNKPLPLPQIAPHLLNLFSHGKQTAATVEKSVQLGIEDILERWYGTLKQAGIQNLAAIVIDIKTNQVVAYCGNVGFNDDKGNQVDIIQSNRSTGSILKPFLYCAMLQDGELLPQMLLPDVPLNINGFSPQNFNMHFEGAVPADMAVARSLNVPLVYMLKQYSVPKFHSFLKDNKIIQLPYSPSHYGLSLILGGAEGKLGAITNAYSNMGRTLLNLPSTQYQISLYEPPTTISTTFQDNAVWQVFEAIRNVNRPEDLDMRAFPSIQTVAWKTGTSYGFRDAWAVGVTPNYAVGVWAGCASGAGTSNLTGASTAGPVMFDIFNALPSCEWFQPQIDISVNIPVCHKSGYPAGRFCQEIDTLLYPPIVYKMSACPFHIQVRLSTDECFRVSESCAENSITKNWFVLPPSWAWFYKQYHPSYVSLPPFKVGCGGGGDYQQMQFIYPQGNAHIHLPKQLDGTPGQITFELAHSRPNATVFWHIDNVYITSTSDFHKLSTHLEKGEHSITTIDDEGQSLSCRVFVD